MAFVRKHQVAAAAAILLVAAAIAAALFVRVHGRPIAPLSTPVTIAPSLFMFRQPAPMIDFYTWDGKLVRRLTTSLGVLPTDDGRLYVDHDGGIQETRGGQVGVVADWDRLYFPMWADDGAHICGITTESNGTPSLEIVGLHGDVRRYSLSPGDQYTLVSACSFSSGRAVIRDVAAIPGGSQARWTFRVLSLRNGTTINTLAWATYERANILLSRDAQWLARQIVQPSGHWVIEVVDLTDGSTKASYADVYPAAFSPDDRLLVVGVFPNNTETRVLDWRAGNVVWSRTTYMGLQTVAAVSDVATDKLLVALHTDTYLEYWIVDGQGSARPFYPVP